MYVCLCVCVGEAICKRGDIEKANEKSLKVQEKVFEALKRKERLLFRLCPSFYFFLKKVDLLHQMNFFDKNFER